MNGKFNYTKIIHIIHIIRLGWLNNFSDEVPGYDEMTP